MVVLGCCLHNRLAEKIRAARVNKERSLQLQEKARLTAQEAEYDKVYDTVCVRACVPEPVADISEPVEYIRQRPTHPPCEPAEGCNQVLL